MKSRMRSLRKKRGMTQQELAQKACVSRQTIISLESEKYDPSLVLAFKIAAIFGLPIEEIFLYNEKE
ncbi:MAG TPA: transcriptional regulator [Firmicutes bacterium]|nr:transcriptional regulator [Bacillota bacterium]